MRFIIPALLTILCLPLCSASIVEAASPLTGTMTAIDGSPVDLASFDGKVVLVVNVASPQIAEFCSSKYAVTFPMFSKITVKGADMPPLYKALTESADPPGAIGWNFEKFLIGRDGAVVGRFKTRVSPDDPALVSAVEAALAAK